MDGQISIAFYPHVICFRPGHIPLLMSQENPKLCLVCCVIPEHRQHSNVHVPVYIILHRLWIACVGHKEWLTATTLRPCVKKSSEGVRKDVIKYKRFLDPSCTLIFYLGMGPAEWLSDTKGITEPDIVPEGLGDEHLRLLINPQPKEFSTQTPERVLCGEKPAEFIRT